MQFIYEHVLSIINDNIKKCSHILSPTTTKAGNDKIFAQEYARTSFILIKYNFEGGVFGKNNYSIIITLREIKA